MSKRFEWCVFVYFKNYKEAILYTNSLVKGSYDIELEER